MPPTAQPICRRSASAYYKTTAAQQRPRVRQESEAKPSVSCCHSSSVSRLHFKTMANGKGKAKVAFRSSMITRAIVVVLSVMAIGLLVLSVATFREGSEDLAQVNFGGRRMLDELALVPAPAPAPGPEAYLAPATAPAASGG
ncbi:hypothetical protein WJX73_006030 [Symbiochloris irregularis]|uniref:Uncharacterized protein n=1 Tax=Symbiochloris irregularis TaxID=706552 RepID=A0AAW1NNK3_9CHLO